MAACERADGAPKEKAAGLAALAPGSDGPLLFEMRFLHPLIHAGAALLSFACGTTSFALASLLYALFTSALFNNKDLLSYDDLASSALPLRTISFLINALTIALVGVLLRAHLRSCAIKPRLRNTLIGASVCTLFVLCYVFAIATSVNAPSAEDPSELASTICMACYSMMVRPTNHHNIGILRVLLTLCSSVCSCWCGTSCAAGWLATSGTRRGTRRRLRMERRMAASLRASPKAQTLCWHALRARLRAWCMPPRSAMSQRLRSPRQRVRSRSWRAAIP